MMLKSKVQVPVAIDLFCGCGGFSTGLLDAGFKVVSGIDRDRPSIECYDYNHSYRGSKGLVADVSNNAENYPNLCRYLELLDYLRLSLLTVIQVNNLQVA